MLWQPNVISDPNCAVAVQWFWLTYEIVKLPNAFGYVPEYGGGDCGGLNDSSTGALIEYNTFYGNEADGIIDTYYEYYSGNGGGICANGGSIIRSNILVNNIASWHGGGIYSADGGVSNYNNVWNNTGGEYYGLTPGIHDISADPLLVDPDNRDFHLLRGSPCIGAGDPANYPSTDFEGDPRPRGPAPDIGADEYYP